jgi:tRNA A-37 threonylcarbamoyl transferase component Bud32
MPIPVSLSPEYHMEPLDLGGMQRIRDDLARTLEGETGVVEQYLVSVEHETRLKESQDNWLMDALYVNHFSEFLSQQVPMATELLHFCLDYRRLLRKDAHQRPQVLSHIYKHYLRAGGAAEADLRKHGIDVTPVLVEEASRMAMRVEEEEKGRQSSIGTPARASGISMSITIPPSMSSEADRGSSLSFRDGSREVKVFNTTNDRILVSTFSTTDTNAAYLHSVVDHSWGHPRRQRHVEPGQTAVVDVVSSGVEAIKLRVNDQKCDAVVKGCVYTYDGQALIPQRLSSFEQRESSAESLPRPSVEEARSVEIEEIEEDMTQETLEADPLMAVEELSHIYEEVVRRLQIIQPVFLMSEEYGSLLDKKAHYSGDWVPQTQHDSEEVLHKGYLNKKGQGFADFLRWRRRYFVLTRNGDFCYYKHQRAYERGDPPMGAIQCREVTDLSCQASDVDFQVDTPKRGYHLSCAQPDERSTWVSALQTAGVPRDVCYDDMRVRKMIGSGSQAAVAEVVDVGTGKGMAMKVYNLAELMKQDNGHKIQHVVNERQLLSELKHPYIITGQAAFHEGDKLFICMDFANGGELWYHMYRNQECPLHRQYKHKDGGSVLGIVLASFYIAEVVLAIGYLHSKAILFADLKPENIAIDSEGHVKLIDFGQCRRGITSMTGQPGDGVPYESNERLGGTHEYFAPELIRTKRKGPLGKALDWWTVGVLFFEMMMKVTPFKGTDPPVDFEAIEDGEWTQDWVDSPGMPFHAQNLAASLLDPDPAERLGTRGTVEIMRHPFFGEMNLADWARLQRVQVCGGIFELLLF